jgi:CheY-like chemotaxis protein
MINYFILEDTPDDILNLKEVYINSVANPSRFVCLFASGDDAEISDAIESLKANNTKVDLVFIDYELTGIYGTDYIDKIDRYFDKPVKILISSEIKLEDEIEIVTPLRQNKDKIYYIRKGVEDLIKDKIKSYLDLHFPVNDINKIKFTFGYSGNTFDRELHLNNILYYSNLATFIERFKYKIISSKDLFFSELLKSNPSKSLNDFNKFYIQRENRENFTTQYVLLTKDGELFITTRGTGSDKITISSLKNFTNFEVLSQIIDRGKIEWLVNKNLFRIEISNTKGIKNYFLLDSKKFSICDNNGDTQKEILNLNTSFNFNSKL